MEHEERIMTESKTTKPKKPTILRYEQCSKTEDCWRIVEHGCTRRGISKEVHSVWIYGLPTREAAIRSFVALKAMNHCWPW